LAAATSSIDEVNTERFSSGSGSMKYFSPFSSR